MRKAESRQDDGENRLSTGGVADIRGACRCLVTEISRIAPKELLANVSVFLNWVVAHRLAPKSLVIKNQQWNLNFFVDSRILSKFGRQDNPMTKNNTHRALQQQDFRIQVNARARENTCRNPGAVGIGISCVAHQ